MGLLMETLIEKSREFRGTLTETILSEGLKIPGYEDYTVHQEGFIVSHKKEPFILKTAKCGSSKKYDFVVLCMNGKPKAHYVHRLVASAFLTNTEDKREVNHKDGNTDNNSSSNLEWVTPKENSNHAVDTGLSLTGEACPWAKQTQEFVETVCSLLEQGFENKEIRAMTGISPQRLFKIKHRRQWKQVSEKYDF